MVLDCSLSRPVQTIKTYTFFTKFRNDVSISTLTNISCWHGLTAGSDGFFSFYKKETLIYTKVHKIQL